MIIISVFLDDVEKLFRSVSYQVVVVVLAVGTQ